MKDVADFIRYLTPSLNDKDRYTYISNFHLYLQVFILFLFLYCKNIFIKLALLLVVALTIYVEISYRECPISILEREFHNESWEDILDIIFKYFKWEITRNEKIVGFTCFNIGILIAFITVTLSQWFSCLFN